MIAHDRDAHRADQKQYGLNAFRPDDGQQSADHGVDARQHAEHDDEEHHRIDAHEGRVGVDAENSAKHDRGRPEGHADVDDDGREQGNDGQPIAAVAVVAAFQEIGQRGHARPQVKRRKEEREQDQGKTGHPLEVAIDHAMLVRGLGKTHEVDGGDVGREHGQPDDRPAERIAGQEVVAALPGRLLAVRPGKAAQGDHPDQIKQYDHQIDSGDLQRHGYPLSGPERGRPTRHGSSWRPRTPAGLLPVGP